MSTLIKLLSDSEITILHIKGQLFLNGISSLTKNAYQSSIIAGLGTNSSGYLDLYIDSDDKERAEQLIQNMGLKS
tara:strand:+ start:78596 stop:78820 length:225 start_codon:yes stop_codon:yes gene_type:complete